MNKPISIAAAAERLSLSPVRVRGLIKEGRLTARIGRKQTSKGFVEVTFVTVESIGAYEVERLDREDRIEANKRAKAAKAANRQVKDSKQYIVELTPEQVEQLREAGFELRPRFVYTPKDKADSAAEIVFED